MYSGSLTLMVSLTSSIISPVSLSMSLKLNVYNPFGIFPEFNIAEIIGWYSSLLKLVGPEYSSKLKIDPLRDEGLEYADKLKSNGVKVILQNHPDEFHGFYHMNDILPGASFAVDKTCKSIKKLFLK